MAMYLINLINWNTKIAYSDSAETMVGCRDLASENQGLIPVCFNWIYGESGSLGLSRMREY